MSPQYLSLPLTGSKENSELRTALENMQEKGKENNEVQDQNGEEQEEGEWENINGNTKSADDNTETTNEKRTSQKRKGGERSVHQTKKQKNAERARLVKQVHARVRQLIAGWPFDDFYFYER